MKLTISRKALVLVCIPLVSQYLFVAVLWVLLTQMERTADEEAASKQIIYRAERVQHFIFESAGAAFFTTSLHDHSFEEIFRKDAEKTLMEIGKLRDSLSTNRQFTTQLDELQRDLKDTFEVIGRQMQVPTDEPHALAQYVVAHDIKSKLVQKLPMINENLRFIADTESKRINRNPQREKQSRAQVRFGLLLSLITGTGATLFVLLIFSRDIIERLNLLVDNTKRLARQESLQPPSKGDDEITYLDSEFRTMAKTIIEASRKEKAMIDNAVDVIFTVDRDLTIQKAGHACKRVLGYNIDQFSGRSLVELLHGDDRHRVAAEMDKLKVEEQRVLTEECRVQRADGTALWILLSVAWSSGDSSFFCVAHDTSGRRELEELKRDFLYMVTHDMRTPLTTLNTFLFTIDNDFYGQLSAPGHKAVQSMERVVVRMQTLVNEILEIEKIEAGEINLQCTQVSLPEVVAYSLEAAQWLAEERKVQLKADHLLDCNLNADRGRLEQILQNIISNAIKYSPVEGTVTVTAFEKDKMCHISISDEGPGVPEEYKDAIFDRFKQVQGETHKRANSSGLGLCICKTLVGAHGGQIGVFNNPAAGSTFWFEIPLEVVETFDPMDWSRPPA